MNKTLKLVKKFKREIKDRHENMKPSENQNEYVILFDLLELLNKSEDQLTGQKSLF